MSFPCNEKLDKFENTLPENSARKQKSFYFSFILGFGRASYLT